MQIGMEEFLDRIDVDIEKLVSVISDKNSELNEINLNIDVKHILEDMQSVLDYIAVEIYEKYYGSHDGKKIYFPYTDNYEEDFKKRVNKYFPNLYDNHHDIYDELVKVQCFYDSSEWIVKLKKITNEVKHNELYITKIKKEKNTILKDDNTSVLIKGSQSIQKFEEGYGAFDDISFFVNGSEQVGFYSDGTVIVGDGTYNFDTEETNNIDIDEYYENIVKSKEYDESIVDLLKLIFNKESQLVSSLERFI